MKIAALLLATLANQSAPEEVPETVFRRVPDIFDCAISTENHRKILFTKKLDELDELAVLTPRGETMHFLVVGAPPDEMQPLMSTEELAQTTLFWVDVSSLQGLEWKVDATSEKVFQEPGQYEFLVSTTLESEEGGYKCSVNYQP